MSEEPTEHADLENSVEIGEGIGVVLNKSRSEKLINDYRGDGSVKKVDLAVQPQKLKYSGYLGVCGIVTVESSSENTRALLHGYFPSSLNALLNSASDSLKPTSDLKVKLYYVPYKIGKRPAEYENLVRDFSTKMGSKPSDIFVIK